MHPDAVAIVPAGGAARRLAGAGKAALVTGGRTFLDRVCTTLAGEVARVIVVTPFAGALPPVAVPVEVVADARPGAGPLAAIRDGLRHALACGPRPRLAVLCSCDAPLVAANVVRLLVDRAAGPGVRWALPLVAGHPQPLVSVLAVDVLPVIEAILARGDGSLRSLAAALEATGPDAVRVVPAADLVAVDPQLDSFRDVDTPADLADVVRRGADPPHRT